MKFGIHQEITVFSENDGNHFFIYLCGNFPAKRGAMELDTVLLIPRVGYESGSEIERPGNGLYQDTVLHTISNPLLSSPKLSLLQDSGANRLIIHAADSSQISVRHAYKSISDSSVIHKQHTSFVQPDSFLSVQLQMTVPSFAIKDGQRGIEIYFSRQFSAKTEKINHHPQTGKVFTTSTKELSSALFQPSQKGIIHPDWFTLILLIAIVLLAWTKNFFGRYFLQSVSALFDFNLSARLFRDKNILLQRVSAVLLLNFIFVGALFIYKSLEFFQVRFFKSSISSFTAITLILAILLIFRSLAVNTLNFLFTKNGALNEYHYQVLNFFKSVGILLLPVVVGISYIHGGTWSWLIWIGIFSITMLYLFRLYKGQRIIKRIEVSRFYLILYLCTLEILPVLIAAKFISKLT